ncbi:MAG: hypothetical protein RSA98_01385 [Odoribacter sp.]
MIKSYLNKGCAVLLGGLLLCASCGDADLFDTDKWSDHIDGWEPSVKAVVAHGDFTMWDLLKDTAADSPIQDENGILVIKYVEKDIYKLNTLSEIFTLPLEVSPITLPSIIVPDVLLVDFSVPIVGDIVLDAVSEAADLQGIPTECDLKEIMFDTDMSVSLPRLAFCDYRVEVVLNNIYESENAVNPLSKTYRVDRGTASQSELLPLKGALLKIGLDKKIRVSVVLTLLDGGRINSGASISGMTISLDNLKFIKAVGKVQIEPMAVNGSFNMDVDFLNKLGGSFRFDNPELNLIVRNKGIGVKTALNMEFWVNQGVGKDKFTGKELILNGNKDHREFISEEVGYRGDALADFLSLPPKGDVYYKGTVCSKGDVDTDVIWNDGGLAIDAEVRIPLSLSATELTYCDTIKDVDIDADIVDKIKSGSIWIVADNGLPLSLKVAELLLVDENYRSLSPVKGEQVLPASAKGKVELNLSEQNIKDLSKMKHILIKINASTAGVVTMRSDAKLKFDLMLEVKAQITDTDF